MVTNNVSEESEDELGYAELREQQAGQCNELTSYECSTISLDNTVWLTPRDGEVPEALARLQESSLFPDEQGVALNLQNAFADIGSLVQEQAPELNLDTPELT